MQRCHSMPFGAEVRGDGRVHFQFFAPAVRQVALCLEQGAAEEILPMDAGQDGWFRIVTGKAKTGSRYRFRINEGMRVPDPASRFNPEDVHGPSEVIDPRAFDWQDGIWHGRPWEDTVIYELHVGTFSPQGTYSGVIDRLDYLADLGVTAIELMPVADFPGTRDWGYDGVLPFAPDHRYGRPEELKELVQSAHAKGLMVFLDVVYNHFGPEGNYLHLYAPQFFTGRHTSWGEAINFDAPGSHVVRDFFIHNALYWLEEFHLDGLRLDAVHAILDDLQPDILNDLAEAACQGPGRERHVHLVLENDHNAARYLDRGAGNRTSRYRAQWNDDIHHALHVLITGETDGYYSDYSDQPMRHLARCLTEGFAYQGEPSNYRHGMARGEPSRHLPPTAFVSQLQTHDQVGNRAFGERIGALAEPQALRAAISILLLSPSPPLLFMGEEFGAVTPFLFFCDFGEDFATVITQGRRLDFARFARFADAAARERIPDPNAADNFARSRLDWECVARPPHREWLSLYHQLLGIRHAEIIPRLRGIQGGRASARLAGDRAIAVQWVLGDGSYLALLANLGGESVESSERPTGNLLFASEDGLETSLRKGMLPPWSVAWFLGPESMENSA